MRALLVGVVAVLAVASYVGSVSEWAVVGVAVPALALDLVDGWVARRTRTVTRFGARFDLETDAALILVLSAYVAGDVGWWVLLLGLARYLLLGAQRLWPVLRGDLPARRWRKLVAALQGVALVLAASPALPRPVDVAVLVVAAAVLAWSFGTEALELLGLPVLSGLSVIALSLVWAALTAPPHGADPSLSHFLRVPWEVVVLVGVVLLLPRGPGRVVALVSGVLLAPLLVIKVLNQGFHTVLDRDFDAVGDWGFLRSGVGVLADSTGRPVAILVAVLAGVLALGLLVLLPWAVLRVAAVARRHRVRAVALATGAALLAVALGATTTNTTSLAVDEFHQVRADLHDRSVFADEIAADRFAGVPGEQLLQGLRGKDVLLVFVESFGRSAVSGSSYAPGIVRALEQGTRQLHRAGYDSRSAFLTSPTFGAGSWLAHATTQAGLWVSSQRRYDQLLDADRLTLTSAFEKAGWRTVLAVPANTLDWPEGKEFYGFDELYDSRNVGYRGPKFGYASMPDQYTLDHFHQVELARRDRPRVMAEIDLISSHHPWTPLPRMVPWDQVGDGSVFDGMPEEGASTAEVFTDPERVRRAYGESVQYSLDVLVSFLTRQRGDDLVVVMLGDHEPHHYVSGKDPGHDVPVSVIARDPDVLDRISSWGWQQGLSPLGGPVWRMDGFRDRFLTAFEDAR